MSVSAQLNELEEINKELKLLNDSVKKLRNRKKIIEENISKYLENNKKPGFRYKGKTITIQTKETRIRRSKQDKEIIGKEILKNSGVDNSEKVYQQIINSMKGSPTQVNTIKIK